MIDKHLIPKAYVEVLEILKYIPTEEYNKIPIEIIKNMKLNEDKEYKYTITHFDNFQEQQMLKETETILAVLFRDYWATEEQKNKIIAKQNHDRQQFENLKKQQHNPNDIFKKPNKYKTESNTALIKYKESFWARFKNFIFKILYIHK